MQSDILSHNADIVLVTETWLSSKQADSELALRDFNLYRLDRKGRRGGGVCIYLHCAITGSKIIEPSPQIGNVEVMWLEFVIQKQVYCIACCYHPPRPLYDPSFFVDKLAADLNFIINKYMAPIIIIAGDFNTLDTGFLEVDYGLHQIVTDATHGKNTLDKVFVNRPDMYVTSVFCSLLKTKHKAVLVHSPKAGSKAPKKPLRRKKVAVYDLRQSNIDQLRFHLGTYDWSSLVVSNSAITIYTWFLYVVRIFIASCIPIKHITVGPRDPDFVTPLVKSLLVRRRKLRSQGRTSEADKLAEKINGLIAEYRKKQLAHLENASPRELWSSVRGRSNRSIPVNHLLCDPNIVNKHFAAIATDHCYSSSDILRFCVSLDVDSSNLHDFCDYEIERLLRTMQTTASGFDDLPCWLFKKCSYELAGIVTTILNMSFQSGIVPLEWLTAVVTPVPKNACPESLAEYRPISVTPIMSRLAEKLVVQQWLRPALPIILIEDQFGFRPTGSTTCALINLMHHVTLMLESNLYVRCLLIDFSKAFDTVRHSLVVAKLSTLDIPPAILNWIVHFLSGRTQVTKGPDGTLSGFLPITQSIIQGSGIGPTLWIVMESDLHPVSAINVLVKYADDTNLLVPENTDVSLADEYMQIKAWADKNCVKINTEKTKELVFHRPHPTKWHVPPSLEGIEQVQTAKLLGVILQSNLNFTSHVDSVLKLCSQRIFLLKQLRDQGMSHGQLHTIFQAIVLNRIVYALSAWGPFLSITNFQRIDGFLKRSYRYGFTSNKIYKIEQLLDSVMSDLFAKIQAPHHCLYPLLPRRKDCYINVRPRGHEYELPSCTYKLHKQSYIVNCLFKFL